MKKSLAPPISKASPTFNFPHFEEYTTKNGIKIILIPDDTQPLLSIKLFIQLGSGEDKIPGEGYFTAQMLSRGTKNQSTSKMAEEIDGIGASFNCISNWDDSVISILTQSANYRKSIRLMKDSFFNPTFAKNEIERFRKIHLAILEHESSDPDYLVSVLFNSSLYGSHSYGNPIMGTKESIAGISRQTCLDWHNVLLNRPNLNIVVSGLYARDKILECLENSFSDWKPSSNVVHSNNKVNYKPKGKLFIENKPDGGQVVLKIGKPSIFVNNPDYPAFQMANTIFGGFFMSRLNKLLREKLGYTYGVHSALSPRKLASTYYVSGSFNRDTIADTLRKTVEEMQRFSTEVVTEEEFFAARQHMLGSFARSVETPQQVSEFFHTIILHGLGHNYLSNYFNAITNMTPDHLFEIQNRHFKPENLIVAVVGEEEFLRKELDFFA